MANRSRTRVLLSSAALVAAVTLAGCGGSAAKTARTASAAASAGGSGASAGTSGTSGGKSSAAGGSSSSAGASSSTTSGAAGKTCSGGHSQAMINGKGKCLAVGQMCSAKAVSQYPQYGFVCATSNGKLVLRRK